MTTVKIMLRQRCAQFDADGKPVLDSAGRVVKLQPKPDEIDLDRLSPRARALAEAAAATPRAEVWVESDVPLRERRSDWQTWYTPEQADQPERRTWSAWDKYRADSPQDPHDYLERQAAKIPAGWHVLGAHPDRPVPTQDRGMTVAQVVETLASHGVVMKEVTWRSYVSRGRAPQPARRDEGDRPLWEPKQITAWLAERPGQGTRTDLEGNQNMISYARRVFGNRTVVGPWSVWREQLPDLPPEPNTAPTENVADDLINTANGRYAGTTITVTDQDGNEHTETLSALEYLKMVNGRLVCRAFIVTAPPQTRQGRCEVCGEYGELVERTDASGISGWAHQSHDDLDIVFA